MKEEVTFKRWGGILVLDWGFPSANKKLDIAADDVNWTYKMRFSVQNSFENSKTISVTLTMKLHYLNPKKKTSIARAEIDNTFNVKGEVSAEGKLVLLYKILEICNWNMQGVFAAGLEGTGISSFVAPDINFEYHEEDFKKKLADEWI